MGRARGMGRGISLCNTFVLFATAFEIFPKGKLAFPLLFCKTKNFFVQTFVMNF